MGLRLICNHHAVAYFYAICGHIAPVNLKDLGHGEPAINPRFVMGTGIFMDMQDFAACPDKQ